MCTFCTQHWFHLAVTKMEGCLTKCMHPSAKGKSICHMCLHPAGCGVAGVRSAPCRRVLAAPARCSRRPRIRHLNAVAGDRRASARVRGVPCHKHAGAGCGCGAHISRRHDLLYAVQAGISGSCSSTTLQHDPDRQPVVSRQTQTLNIASVHPTVHPTALYSIKPCKQASPL